MDETHSMTKREDNQNVQNLSPQGGRRTYSKATISASGSNQSAEDNTIVYKHAYLSQRNSSHSRPGSYKGRTPPKVHVDSGRSPLDGRRNRFTETRLEWTSRAGTLKMDTSRRQNKGTLRRNTDCGGAQSLYSSPEAVKTARTQKADLADKKCQESPRANRVS